ncbi:N-6 DNA methylase, partial [bacterium]|nr:N-6 DNA methylase [bacterium]
ETFKKTYNEEMLRIEFVNPFFEALGWDIANKTGNAEAYKDVIHEDAIKIGSATKAPDYAFRIGGVKKFFVEAKKPAVNIKDDIHPAFQLRRYAWSAKLPLSILTDFEEFAVYDCRIRPFKTDKASVGRVMFYTFEDYIEKWDEIAEIFSKDAIYKGSFDKYIESSTKKRGTAEVDDAFLKEIETWREMLARNIALRNTDLTQRELNFAVARTIDRIVFLRIAEDRGMEDYGQLQALKNSENVYEGLVGLYRRADDKYNSGLFHFRQEKDRAGSADELTTKLTIDDKVIKDIVKNLYYPDSSYEFSVLPADILGHIYEQFLGKVISLTVGHHAKIEEKPEVRKAGGVYYTPTYIVDYIVKNTVGELLKDKTPQQVVKLRILDPACGSGSFLIGAYQYLLDWHRDWYSTNEPEKYSKGKNPAVFKAGINDWRLTTAKRKEILLNNIYGVDIDPQAVEVSKLSLLLKVLEGESKETLNQQRKLFNERALPDLGNNIKCGNSLIGPDFYDNQQINLLDNEERYRINVFDWEAEFPKIFAKGGFDAVIGNPPYVRSQQIELYQKEYFSNAFEAASYQPDTFALFIERGIKITREKGKLSFIVPSGLLTNLYYSKLREFILNKTLINVIVDLKDGVFKKASVDTFILVATKNKGKLLSHEVSIGEHPVKIYKDVITPSNKVNQEEFLNFSKYQFNTGLKTNIIDLIEKINLNAVVLEKVFTVKNGMKVRKEFVTNVKVDSRYEKFLLGKNVKPYKIDYEGLWVCYDKKLEKKYTNQAFRERSIFEKGQKILVRQVMGATKIHACCDDESFFVDQSIYLLLPRENQNNIYYYLGLMCSKITMFYFSNTMADRKKTFPKIKGDQIKNLPLLDITTANVSTVKKITEKSKSMTMLYQTLPKAKTDHDRTILQRQIDATDKQIDKLVYELYDLTDEEIKIVEEDA